MSFLIAISMKKVASSLVLVSGKNWYSSPGKLQEYSSLIRSSSTINNIPCSGSTPIQTEGYKKIPTFHSRISSTKSPAFVLLMSSRQQ